MLNQKAQGLSINTIILIILGVVVLVALIFGFTKGWEGIRQWISPSNNIAEVKSQCDIACTTENKYNYCYQQRDVKVEKDSYKGVSCYTLTKVKTEFGINSCVAINCGIYDSPGAASESCNENTNEEVWFIGTDESNKINNAILTKINCNDIQLPPAQTG